MLGIREAGTAIEQACHRRYPAWTLVARALTGNRPDAEDTVRRAVARTMHGDVTPSSESDAHELVLRSIRESAHPPLRILRDDRILTRFRELPRKQQQALELVLRRRPPLSPERAARKLDVTLEELAALIDDGLRQLPGNAGDEGATGSTLPGHPSLGELVAYVNGALSGDEARDVIAHCRPCMSCGDRLGAMIVLRTTASETARVSRVSRSQRKTGLGLVTASGVFGIFLGVQALLPNPWAELATQETVPRWFHDFFYGERRADQANDASPGLELIVQGKFEEAIQTLEPLSADDPEASAYLGIARYLTGDTSRRTVKLLEAGTKSSRARRLARWYLASVLLTRKDVGGAREQLEALASVRDWFGRAAEALLEKLDRASEASTAA